MCVFVCVRVVYYKIYNRLSVQKTMLENIIKCKGTSRIIEKEHNSIPSVYVLQRNSRFITYTGSGRFLKYILEVKKIYESKIKKISHNRISLPYIIFFNIINKLFNCDDVVNVV